jgi:hypothetical protein
VSEDHIAAGTPDAYRAYIEERMAMARIYATVAEDYARLADIAGLDHAMRQLIGTVRQAVGATAVLKGKVEELSR